MTDATERERRIIVTRYWMERARTNADEIEAMTNGEWEERTGSEAGWKAMYVDQYRETAETLRQELMELEASDERE